MTFEGLFLHFIEVNQFVDSPEYDSVKTFDTEEKFQVCIRKTSPCNEHPLKPNFYIVKLGFTGVYIFSYFCSKT